jgi:Ca-activated chloride channel family protein
VTTPGPNAAHIRRGLLACPVLVAAIAIAAAEHGAAAGQNDATAPSIRITSPLGRTGLAGKVRIVAHVQPAGGILSPVSFLVDGALIGTTEAGPSCAVDWTDENPFEPREIVVQAMDAKRHMIRDVVVLPPFQITDTTDVNSVLLETGVYDQTGRFVADVDPASFVVRENDVRQKIDLVTREALPTTLLLLVDNSQSMSRRMDFVRQAAERLGRALRRRDKVIVAPFNAHVGTVTGPTDDAATLAGAIAAMQSGGGTAILDGLLEGTRLLRGIEGRRAIILITDGYDENSTSAVADVLKRAEDSQVTIYVVGIGGVAGISLRGERMLRQLADQTGGRVFFPPREPDLITVSDALATDAHSRYLLTYTPSDRTKDGSWRGISVEVPAGYRVRTRAGYFAPSPPPIRPAIEFIVTNASHDYVDVAAEDLEVLEDGVTQAVDTFQEAVDPVAIVMALDSSGSMKKSADTVRQTARDFVVAVRPEDSLALITFADQPLFAHTLATNRQWTLGAIDKYNPAGGTALYDALWNSLLHLKSVQGRRAVVVLTDGKDENNPGTAPGSTHTLDQVLELGRQVGATVFAIGLGTKVERQILERLASQSGGEAYFPSDVSLLTDEYRLIIENLRRRYVLSYTSTNARHDGGWRAVEIRPRNRDLAVATGGGYFAPDR